MPDPISAPDLGQPEAITNLDLGSGAPLMQSAQAGERQQAGQQPPKPSAVPALAGFLQQMIQGPKATVQPGESQPMRPPSRLDAFENFIGNFLNSFATGMSASGQGPAANARGFGAAVQAPYQRQLGQYQLGQQQQLAGAQVAEETGRAAESEARARQMGQMVTLPDGVTMPLALAQKVYPAMISGQAKVTAAGEQKQFMTTPFGVFDTRSQKFVGTSAGGVGATVKMTPEMANSGQFGPGAAQLVGKDVKLTDLNGMERATAQGYGFVQGAAGPAREQKVGPTGNLGLGSPAANAIAQGKLSLAQQQFERDTFGTLMGKAIPSSLLDETGNTIGWKSPAAPTSSIKTQAQQASDLSTLFKKVQTKLAEAQKAGKLGPTQGRVNEFMTGTVGADDPLFAEVRALGSLTASGMLKAHFGARGGQQMYDHFEALFNTGKMTYNDLIGAMKGFSTFMDQYATRVRTAGSANPNVPKPNAGAAITFTPITH